LRNLARCATGFVSCGELEGFPSSLLWAAADEIREPRWGPPERTGTVTPLPAQSGLVSPGDGDGIQRSTPSLGGLAVVAILHHVTDGGS
jgi:hypothetical protein